MARQDKPKPVVDQVADDVKRFALKGKTELEERGLIVDADKALEGLKGSVELDAAKEEIQAILDESEIMAYPLLKEYWKNHSNEVATWFINAQEVDNGFLKSVGDSVFLELVEGGLRSFQEVGPDLFKKNRDLYLLEDFAPYDELMAWVDEVWEDYGDVIQSKYSGLKPLFVQTYVLSQLTAGEQVTDIGMRAAIIAELSGLAIWMRLEKGMTFEEFVENDAEKLLYLFWNNHYGIDGQHTPILGPPDDERTEAAIEKVSKSIVKRILRDRFGQKEVTVEEGVLETLIYEPVNKVVKAVVIKGAEVIGSSIMIFAGLLGTAMATQLYPKNYLADTAEKYHGLNESSFENYPIAKEEWEKNPDKFKERFFGGALRLLTTSGIMITLPSSGEAFEYNNANDFTNDLDSGELDELLEGADDIAETGEDMLYHPEEHRGRTVADIASQLNIPKISLPPIYTPRILEEVEAQITAEHFGGREVK